MKKVLVTGADGFIGSHLVEMLLEKGYKVKALCLYNSFGSCGWLDTLPKEKIKDVEIILGDIRDPICVREAVKQTEIIFHLAALIAIPYSYVAPSSYVDTNIHGTLNVLQAAKDFEVSRLIHTSTSETYGSAQFVPITEDHPLVGQSPYSASKIGADHLAISFWKSFSTPVTILRPFNTYGPRQSNRAVIPQIITQILQKQKTIKLGDISPTRDFNFVIDTCEAFISVSKSSSTLGEVINSASQFEISIKETVELTAEIIGSQIEIIADKRRIRPAKSEVNRLFGSNQKLKRLTDWNPKYSGKEGFKNGLKSTIEWFSDSNNLKNYRNDYVI